MEMFDEVNPMALLAKVAKQVGAGSDALGTANEVAGVFGADLMGTKESGLNTAIGAACNFSENLAKGHGLLESGADTTGKLGAGVLAEKLGVKTLGGTAINFVNDTLTAVGAPKSVTNLSGLAADCTPDKVLETGLRQGSRALVNLVTGDDEALEQQYQEGLDGDGGTPLQGYLSWYDAYQRMEGGEDPRDALPAAASGMDDTVVEDVFNLISGTEDDDGVHYEDVPEDGVYKASSGNDVIDWVCEDLLGL
jgi:hypothetical protein